MTTDPEGGRRISLTKAQRESSAGAELLALCQSTTADGALAPEEIEQIRQWLNKHRDSGLPAVTYLIPVVERILADGLVTPAESRDLFIAIEKVLPADVRGLSKAARSALESSQKSAKREDAENQRLLARTERERHRAVARFDFMVAGTRYEGRSAIIDRYVEEGSPVTLQRDRGNAHSRNAIAVLIGRGDQIGFVPEDDACELAPLLDSGYKYNASVKKLLTGGQSAIPVVVAAVYKPDANVAVNVLPTQEKSYYFFKGLLRIFIAMIVVAVIVRACVG